MLNKVVKKVMLNRVKTFYLDSAAKKTVLRSYSTIEDDEELVSIVFKLISSPSVLLTRLYRAVSKVINIIVTINNGKPTANVIVSFLEE